MSFTSAHFSLLALAVAPPFFLSIRHSLAHPLPLPRAALLAQTLAQLAAGLPALAPGLLHLLLTASTTTMPILPTIRPLEL